jgi:hypothetical protein
MRTLEQQFIIGQGIDRPSYPSFNNCWNKGGVIS